MSATIPADILPRWRALRLRPGVLGTTMPLVQRLAAHRARYAALGVPWWWAAAIHQMESDADFSTHLHNGDPLTRRTTHVPAGRPPSGDPPFTWEQSAADALALAGVLGQTDWSLGPALWRAERYNGLGYRARGLPSPYLWAGSTAYSTGRFTADGTFDRTSVQNRPGVAVLLYALRAAGLADLGA